MSTTLTIFSILGVVLLIASIIGAFLSFKHPTSATVQNLNARIAGWWMMVIVIGVAFLTGFYGLVVLFGVISFFALREILTLIVKDTNDYYALIAAFYLILPIQYVLVGIEWETMVRVFIPVYGFLLLPILAVLSGETKNYLERTAKVQWGLMITVYCLSYIPALISLNIPQYENRHYELIAWFILVVQSSDVLQYVVGKILGKHLIAPKLSPSKTVEGFIGGVLLATLIGAGLYSLTPFNFWQAFVMALIVTLLGFSAGLVLSAIKRDYGVKDWGHMIKGHGGMLDRVDSLTFAAPIFYSLLRYYWSV